MLYCARRFSLITTIVCKDGMSEGQYLEVQFHAMSMTFVQTKIHPCYLFSA